MVIENIPPKFTDWLLPGYDQLGALVFFLVLCAGLLLLSLLVAYIRCAFLYGPGEGFFAVAKAMVTAVGEDLPNTSPRRIWAIARLSIQESIRNRVLIVFGIFALILLFAGWFLDTRSDHPGRLYLGFVLSSTELLVLIMAVVLSAFSLPNDIQSRTIYTVVTKPVRSNEIVLGRIFGFCLVISALLLLMCVVSYFFVVRGLNHTHQVAADQLEEVVSGGQASGWKGETSLESYHRHEVTIGADGSGQTDRVMDHYHSVTAIDDGGRVRYEIGPPVGALTAKTYTLGTLRFLDRTGRPTDRGVNVGDVWTYRSYIEGGSLATAIWTFSEIDPADYPEFLPVEMTLGVFRTYKADIVTPIRGEITVRNPTTGRRSEPLPFFAKEFQVATLNIPRKLKAVDRDGSLSDIDLFADLMDEHGQFEIAITCSDPAQYFGMATPDLYIRGHDGLFFVNFVKGYAGIWIQAVIITCFTVMFSTFLNGPVAMFATLSTYIVGRNAESIMAIATGAMPGGGPLESLIRLVTQKNLTIELDLGWLIEGIVKVIDGVLLFFVWVSVNALPDYSSFNTSNYVAYGFNIGAGLLGQHLLIMVGYVLTVTVFGYFFLKTREIAG